MGRYTFSPSGVCSAKIEFEIDNGYLKNVHFTRGCNGNTQGISRLVEGMKASEVIERLKNVDCGGRGTSCPDQLAKALELALEQE